MYALMKCKANKARPIAAAGDLGHEVNLLFLFGETWIAPAGITPENFY